MERRCSTSGILALWVLLAGAVVIAPIVLSFSFGLDINPLTEISVGIYGILSISHYILQLIFALLNRSKSNKVFKQDRKETSIGVQVVGWREKPDYFYQCLESVKKCVDAGIKKRIVVVDGNEEEDRYMGAIFKKIFPTGKVIMVEETLYEMNLLDKRNLVRRVQKHPEVCILQPHKGKRHAMYTGMYLIEHLGYNYTTLIDSDTMLKNDAITIMAKVLDNNKKIAAVTGNMQIFNITGILPFLASYRYWFAGNLERAAQSYFNVVSCISGPMGTYKTNIITKIREDWMTQTLFGRPCTYGDDRHLTNLTMSLGFGVRFNHNAICYTETPAELNRWISQQNRWSKSFIREYFINIRWFHKHSWWLTYDMTFLLFYGYFLFFFSIILLTRGDVVPIIYLLGSIIALSLLRSIFAIIVDFNLGPIYFVIYSFLFFLVILPLKVWSILTIWSNAWGGGNRKFKSCNFIDSLSVIGWAGFLTTMIVLADKDISDDHIQGILYVSAIVIGVLVVLYPLMLWHLNAKMTKIVVDKFRSDDHLSLSSDSEVPTVPQREGYPELPARVPLEDIVVHSGDVSSISDSSAFILDDIKVNTE